MMPPIRKPFVQLLLVCLGLALLASFTGQDGESGDWPFYRGGPAMQGVAPGKLGDKPELAWSFETGDAIISSPVVVDGLVFVGSSDCFLYALDLETGEKRWAFETDDMIDAPPLILEGKVFFGSADFFFYALDAKSGELLWKFETDDKIVGGANYLQMPDGQIRLVVGSYDNRLYCLDAASGKKLWIYETDNYVNGTPAIHDGTVVFGGCDAVLHRVSVATGEAVSQLPLGQDCHVAGSVAMEKGKVYFGHYGNEFVCVDLKSGDLDWAYPSPTHAFFSSPAIAEDRLVFGGRDKKLHCVRKDSGEPLWTFKTKRKIDGSPLICGDKVVFGSGDGRVYMLALEDGKELWQFEVGRPIYSSPAIVDGMILIGANDGRLYAFRAKP